MIRTILVAAPAVATFLVAAPALAAADLQVDIPAPAPTNVYEAISYEVEVSNIGNRRAKNVELTIELPATNTSPSVYVMGTLGSIDNRCALDGTDLVCDLGRLGKNKSKTVAFDIELPQAAQVLSIDASASTTSSENSLSNNSASDTPTLLNFSTTLQPGDMAHVQHCTGTGLTSFFECICSPSSISSHDLEFLAGGQLSFVDVPPSFWGEWSQDTPDSLSMTYYDGTTVVAEFEGYGTSPGCFEGLTTFPGGSWVSPYEVCI